MVLPLVAGLLAATAAALWYLPRNSARFWKITARIAAGVLICASALPLLLFLFTTAMCGRYELPPISSRDGKLAAEVSEEDCGAIDSFHSSVHLWQHPESFFAHWFGKREHPVFTVGHDPRLIDLSWKDDRTLLIRYPSDSRDPANFAVSRNGRAFELNALDMYRITASLSEKCHPSREDCGEGPRSISETSPSYSLTGLANFSTFPESPPIGCILFQTMRLLTTAGCPISRAFLREKWGL